MKVEEDDSPFWIISLTYLTGKITSNIEIFLGWSQDGHSWAQRNSDISGASAVNSFTASIHSTRAYYWGYYCNSKLLHKVNL